MHRTGEKVVRIEAQALNDLADRIVGKMADAFNRGVEVLYACGGRVVVTGMGKSGLVARKIAATLSSTGTPALFMHPVEALHGDLGMLARGDVVMALSASGETEEILHLLATIKRLQLPLIAVTCDAVPVSSANPDPKASSPAGPSTLAAAAEVSLSCAVAEEVTPQTNMPEVIYEMSRKKLGVTAVVEDGKLVGIISDGDLRRLLERRGKDALDLTAGECMTRDPKTISGNEFAATALALMEERKITSLAVIGADGNLEGIVHLHDLWGTEIV